MVMLEALAKQLKDVWVLRRLLFAVSTLPCDLPNFWDIAVEFATKGHLKENIDAKTARALMENVETFDKTAFSKDEALLGELVSWTPRMFSKPLGIILISPKDKCVICGHPLVVRKDRHSSITVYHMTMGPLPGMHFYKICSNNKCSVVQHYGYYTLNELVHFDTDWASHEFFISSSLSAFSMLLIKQVDSQILIGQLSYLQIAELFKHMHLFADKPSTYRYIYLDLVTPYYNYINLINNVIDICRL